MISFRHSSFIIRHLFLLLGLWTLALGLPVSAQLPPLRHYRVEDGMVQRQVMTAFEDSKGAIWFGTKGGLSRFNGADIDNWNVQNGLISNYVTSILEGKDNKIYVFTQEGISIIKDGNVIKNLDFPRKLELRAMASDSIGQIYFIADWEKSEEFFILKIDHDSIAPVISTQLSDGAIINIFYDKISQEFILVDSHGQYHLFQKETIQALPNSPKFRHYYYPDTVNYSLNDQYRSLLDKASNSYSLPFVDPEKMYIWSEGLGWCWRERNRHQAIMYLSESLHEEHILNYPFNYVSNLFRDRSNQVWICTENGVIRIFNTPFTNFTNPESITDPWCIIEDPKGVIWVGNYGNGMVKIDHDQIIKVEIPPVMTDSAFDKHARTHLYSGGIVGFNGETLFNTSRGVIELKDGKFQTFWESDKGYPVYASFRDEPNQRLIFSVFNEGVYAYNLEKGMRRLTDSLPYEFDRIYALMQDRNNRIWVGSADSIAILDGEQLHPVSDFGIPISNGAYSCVQNEEGAIFIGNDYGLFMYDFTSNKQIKHEYLETAVYDIQVLPDNRLLIGTSRGVEVVFLDNYLDGIEPWLKHYDFRNGYNGGEVKINGFSMDSQGRVWIAGTNGVVKLDPSHIQFDLRNIYPEIRAFKVLEQDGDWKEVIKTDQGDYELKSFENSLTIQFRSIDIVSSGFNKFRYRLLPKDLEWNIEEDRSEILFRDLRPGRYEFQLGYKTMDGHWSSEVTTLKFNISPAFFQTVLFMGCLIGLGITLIIYLTFIFTRIRQQNRNQRNREARELSDLRLKTFKSQMDPHFTFNALNSIGYAIQHQQPEVAYEYLGKFSRLVRSLLNNAELNLVSLEEEMEFVRIYLEIEKFRYEDRLTFDIQRKENVDLSQRIPKMIIQIHVENAIKHGLMVKNEGGHLIVRISQIGYVYSIEVEDNGVGRKAPSSRASRGNGMGLKMVDQMISLINTSGDTNISQEIIDLTDTEGNPAGTLIKILISHNP